MAHVDQYRMDKKGANLPGNGKILSLPVGHGKDHLVGVVILKGKK